MAKSGQSRAQANRAIRQEALRDQLANQKLIEHVLDVTAKLANLDEELDSVQVQRLRAVCENNFKLIGKYLPDLKSIEMDVTTGGESLKDLSTRDLLQRVHEFAAEARISADRLDS